jgi:uncharacterized protein
MKRIQLQPAACTALFTALICGLLCQAGAAAPTNEGITVTGSGEVRARPNRLELDVAPSGTAELGSDALVKYEQAVRRTRAAFDALQLDKLKIEERGLAISSVADNAQMQARVAGGDDETVIKSQVMLSRNLRLVLAGIDALDEEELAKITSRLLDTAKDVGVAPGEGAKAGWMEQITGQQGNRPAVTFTLTGVDELLERAYQQAFEQARRRAERIAKLAGVRLGPLLAIEEAGDAGGDELTNRVLAMYGATDSSEKKEPDCVSSDVFREIPVRVNLRVRFAVNPVSQPGATPAGEKP